MLPFPQPKKPVLQRLTELCDRFVGEKIDEAMLTRARHAVIHLLQHAQLEGEIPVQFNVLDVKLEQGADEHELIVHLNSDLEAYLVKGTPPPLI